MDDIAMTNFTPRAQQVLALAKRESERFNHAYVGTEHLLLGIIKLGQGTAVSVLGRIGVTLDSIRAQVEQRVGKGTENFTGAPRYSPRLNKVLSLAQKEARALNHMYVGTEHILLGLLREGDGL